MGMMHVRSGNLRSNWCCKSLLTLTQYLQGMQYGRERVTSLEKQLQVIEAELLLTFKDLNLLKSQMKVKNKLDVAKFELTDVKEVKTTSDEGMAFSNLWRTHGERTDCLVRSRCKVTPTTHCSYSS